MLYSAGLKSTVSAVRRPRRRELRYRLSRAASRPPLTPRRRRSLRMRRSSRRITSSTKPLASGSVGSAAGDRRRDPLRDGARRLARDGGERRQGSDGEPALDFRRWRRRPDELGRRGDGWRRSIADHGLAAPVDDGDDRPIRRAQGRRSRRCARRRPAGPAAQRRCMLRRRAPTRSKSSRLVQPKRHRCVPDRAAPAPRSRASRRPRPDPAEARLKVRGVPSGGRSGEPVGDTAATASRRPASKRRRGGSR